MIVSQIAVTHALTMRSFGNLNRSHEIQQQDSNAPTITRLTKTFASQVDALAKLARSWRRAAGCVDHVHIDAGEQAIVGAVAHPGGPGAKPRTTSCNEQRELHSRFRWQRDAEPKPGPGDRASLQW
jgi:hypothetical protein